MDTKALLERCNAVPTDSLDYVTWLENRKGSIGGSDAGAIMGCVGQWGSPLTVFLQKTGNTMAKEMSSAAKRGKILEPVIREYFKEEYPKLTIEKLPYMLYHPEYPFISANLDGIIDAGDGAEINGNRIEGLGGLEIKSTKSGYGFGSDEIPDGYYCQIQHYLAVTGLNWFILAAYFLEKEEMSYYVIPRDETFIAKLIEAETKFWKNNVLTGEWPPALGIDAEEDMITGMFEGGMTLVLGDTEKDLCRQYVEASAKAKEAEAEKERISSEIKAAIVKQQSGGKGEKKISAFAGKYSISWSRYMRHSIDTEAMKKAGVYEQYSKTSESGMFRITEKKVV